MGFSKQWTMRLVWSTVFIAAIGQGVLWLIRRRTSEYSEASALKDISKTIRRIGQENNIPVSLMRQYERRNTDGNVFVFSIPVRYQTQFLTGLSNIKNLTGTNLHSSNKSNSTYRLHHHNCLSLNALLTFTQ